MAKNLLRTGRGAAGLLFAWLLVLALPTSVEAVVFRGLGLNEVMASYGFGPPSEYGRSAVYRSRTTTVIFEAGSRRVVVNGLSVYLNRSVLRAAGNWVIAPVDAVDTIGAILLPSRALRKASAALVVLDPGHGGADPGTGQGSLLEKAFTLDIAKRVRSRLRDSHVNVMLTRDRDITMSLEERCWRADRYGADVFVSIHLNASRNPMISGIETFIVPASGYPATGELEQNMASSKRKDCSGNRFDGANIVLAQYLQTGLLAHTGAADRGIRRARFYVIRNANSPAALVECGFLSNRGESRKIMDAGYREHIAEGVARGILTYLSRVRKQHLPPIKNM